MNAPASIIDLSTLSSFVSFLYLVIQKNFGEEYKQRNLRKLVRDSCLTWDRRPLHMRSAVEPLFPEI
jgi:hypothetical protein